MAKATTVVNGLPESVPSWRGRHPHLYGALVALGGFLLVALPLAGSVFLAAFMLSGCPDSGGAVSSEQGIFACHEPQRPEATLLGTLAALVALILFALPVIAGVLTARAGSRRPGPPGR
jgi:uncharacterized membrane protein